MSEQMPSANPSPGNEYDHLMDPNADLSSRSIEDAAIRPEPVVPMEAPQVESGAKPPLTTQEISAIEQQRGQGMTQADINGINAAREQGKHL